MYAKVFAQIFDSSLASNRETRWIFIDLLILADQNGVVDMTQEAIARRTNVPEEIVRRAILELESPDPRSRSPEQNGARLKRLDDHRDWGWFIVNYERYRSMANAAAYREVNKEKVAASRARSKSPPAHSPDSEVHSEAYAAQFKKSLPVITGNYKPLPPVTKPGRFAPPSIDTIKLHGNKIGLPDFECERFFNHYTSNGWKVGRNPMRSWQAAMVNWRTNWMSGTYQNGSKPSTQPSLALKMAQQSCKPPKGL